MRRQYVDTEPLTDVEHVGQLSLEKVLDLAFHTAR